ncbi:MAG: hypothetical protein LC793_04940 [Thermomicrobia bacterium]|nr:hypothetical protein [Thermomicrobia bacterium]
MPRTTVWESGAMAERSRNGWRIDTGGTRAMDDRHDCRALIRALLDRL